MNSSVSAPLLPLHFHYLENRLSVAKQLSEEALNFQIEVGYVFRDSNNATVSLAKKGDIPFSLHELYQLEQLQKRSREIEIHEENQSECYCFGFVKVKGRFRNSVNSSKFYPLRAALFHVQLAIQLQLQEISPDAAGQ